MVTPLEDPRDIYADSTLLRPVVDDDVGPTWLIVVRAHDDLDPCEGVTCIRPRIDESGLHRPAIERGDVVAIVLPRHGRGSPKNVLSLHLWPLTVPRVHTTPPVVKL